MSLCNPIFYPLPRRPYFSTPQRRVDLGGAILLHRRGDMRVQIQRDADSRMAEAFLCDLRVHPGKQELCRMTVAKVVKPDPRGDP